ncbi:MAG: toxin-antitoxin system YwqK family antitoxin [Planctomycetes bacterium]|nr:toxin-antitoxin system YwqK family antitoxin [Planctomycetota bacterium]
MKLLQPVTFSFLAILVTGISFVAENSAHVCAQEVDSTEIYLDEPEKEPPPTVVRQDTQKANYDDENPRLERGVAYLSNDQVVSHGKYVEFYRSGQKYSEGTYDMGLHTGQWKYWHPNEQICKSVNFKAGKPHGQWDVFRPDGSREASKGYENGMRHGPWIIYFEDGKQPKIELTYNQGQIDGERLIYYANGQLRQQIPFENGLMHGKVTNWDEEGKKVSEMQFEEGKLVGKPKQL